MVDPPTFCTTSNFSRDSWKRHTISAGTVDLTRKKNDGDNAENSKQTEGKAEEKGPDSSLDNHQKFTTGGTESAKAQDSERQQTSLQPDIQPVTEEQLIIDVRGIYAGLVMAEKECIETVKQHTKSLNKLSDHQWQALIYLHQILLQEHHDFFLASQHPSASPALKQLPERYAMPARMWRYGIHSFLELLHCRLPDSREYILTFLYLAYSMMTLFLESVPAFECTWIECLGDLARYGMAVENSGLRDCETWASVARYWYYQAVDKNPNDGRIQHHLAVVAWQDMIQQLFYYTKCLVSVRPFPTAGESIQLLFRPLLNEPKPYNQPAVAVFMTIHGKLFTQHPLSDFKTLMNAYLLCMDGYIRQHRSAFKMHGVFIASCNFAAIFQYGSTDAVLPNEFKEGLAEDETPVDNLDAIVAHFRRYRNLQSQEKLIYYGAHLTFKTLSALLDHIGDANVFPAVHAYLAFIWCMARNGTSIRHIELVVPWRKLTVFLNAMIWSNTDFRVMERDEIPVTEDKRCFPEDFLLRGQVWSQRYFSADYFEGALAEDDGLRASSMDVARMYRCLWLGVQLAGFNLWIIYDSTSQKFSVTQFALELEHCAQDFDL
ncbi:hypothetical protein SI65_06017 [Aspergillus cristatus]|uniref:DNA/RNA-binding domain-containing protein n=1 Tax=Aspergillus cristatus TaxID=573508 RepID=A0A1E3BCM8_ASPCR|nr:hypothetical protein SI65_06017 [Aspergillus cristatus]